VEMRENNKRNIYLLAWTSLLNDMSSEMIMPILPMFLQSLGAGPVVISLLGGLRDGLGNILKMLFGHISDKTGRRKVFIVGGYLFSSVCKLFLAISRSWPFAMVFALLERVGKGMRNAPRDALIAESMPKHEGFGFGLHRMMDTIGAILGSLLVLLLYWGLQLKFNLLILIAAIIGFLTLIPLVWVKEYRRDPVARSLVFDLKVLPGKMKLFLGIAFLYSLGELSYMLFISRAEYMAFGRYKILAPLAFYVAFNVLYAAFSVPFGLLLDRIGGRRAVSIGYALMTLTLFGFAFFRPMWGFVLFGLYGISKAALQGNQTAYVGRMASDEIKGTAIGTFQTLAGIAMILGNLIAGLIWKAFGLRWAFIYAGTMTGLALIFMFVFWRKMDELEKKQERSSIWLNKRLR